MSDKLAILIPWLPALAAALCGVCATKKSWQKFAAPICVASIAVGFLISVGLYFGHHYGDEAGGNVVTAFEWIVIDGFEANFSYFLDPLTMVMLFVVTGIGTLVAWYASGYMKGDGGYARFFVGVSLFIFSMTSLIMGDNLILLYLGWEGVGLCSYLLIGHYYDKPSAVAAAKKAFIVNRIGDLGFALGIMCVFIAFGSVQYADFIPAAKAMVMQDGGAGLTGGALAAYQSATGADSWLLTLAPFLFMLGAFGKSAQIPLYVWLPDAMEGPTPVSALIHAATMVTSGVYMIARILPVFLLSEYALPTVAVIGGITALFAATIAMGQYDLKKVFAYSTVSQLGYMFIGIGALSTVGGVFHLMTHAFFKALLFLTAGSVMHALAGQLDMRKMSGLKNKMPVTCWLMFVGCVALAGLPPLSGFWSKDLILGDTLAMAGSTHNPAYYFAVIFGAIAAFITPYYTFRLWFRVFLGEERWEMGDDHHAEEGHGDEHGNDAGHDAHAHEPHEMPMATMNAPLIVLAAGSVLVGLLFHFNHWMETMVQSSTASTVGLVAEHGGGHEGADPHVVMMVVSIILALAGTGLAAFFHWKNRAAGDALGRRFKGAINVLYNKYYVDEIYDAVFVRPLRGAAVVFFMIDRMVIDGVVALVGLLPKTGGIVVRETMQRGKLQGYGVGMAFGLAVLVLVAAAALLG